MDSFNFTIFVKELKAEAKKRNIYRHRINVGKFIECLKYECDNSFLLWSRYGDVVVKCFEFYKVLEYKIGEVEYISLKRIINHFLRSSDFSNTLWN